MYESCFYCVAYGDYVFCFVSGKLRSRQYYIALLFVVHQCLKWLNVEHKLRFKWLGEGCW